MHLIFLLSKKSTLKLYISTYQEGWITLDINLFCQITWHLGTRNVLVHTVWRNSRDFGAFVVDLPLENHVRVRPFNDVPVNRSRNFCCGNVDVLCGEMLENNSSCTKVNILGGSRWHYAMWVLAAVAMSSIMILRHETDWWYDDMWRYLAMERAEQAKTVQSEMPACHWRGWTGKLTPWALLALLGVLSGSTTNPSPVHYSPPTRPKLVRWDIAIFPAGDAMSR